MIEEKSINEGNIPISSVFPDDGPSFMYPSHDIYKKATVKDLKRYIDTGWTIVSHMIDDGTEENIDFRIYPDGPVGSVSFFPAGDVNDLTPNNQENLFGSEAYAKWKTHILGVIAKVGWTWIQNKKDEKEDEKASTDAAKDIEKEKKELDKKDKEVDKEIDKSQEKITEMLVSEISKLQDFILEDRAVDNLEPDDLNFLIDQLANSMEYYDENEFVKHLKKETKFNKTDLKKIFKEYWKLDPRQRFGFNKKDWIRWLRENKVKIKKENVMPENLNEARSDGHIKMENRTVYVDSNFVNNVKGVLPNSELKHMGMGDFALETPDGTIEFNRTSKNIDGFVGRAHKMKDSRNGKLIAKLIAPMMRQGKAIQAENINEIHHSSQTATNVNPSDAKKLGIKNIIQRESVDEGRWSQGMTKRSDYDDVTRGDILDKQRKKLKDIIDNKNLSRDAYNGYIEKIKNTNDAKSIRKVSTQIKNIRSESISRGFSKAVEKYRDEELKLQKIRDKQQELVKKFKNSDSKGKERLKKDLIKMHRAVQKQKDIVDRAERDFNNAVMNEPEELQESSVKDAINKIKGIFKSSKNKKDFKNKVKKSRMSKSDLEKVARGMDFDNDDYNADWFDSDLMEVLDEGVEIRRQIADFVGQFNNTSNGKFGSVGGQLYYVFKASGFAASGMKREMEKAGIGDKLKHFSTNKWGIRIDRETKMASFKSGRVTMNEAKAPQKIDKGIEKRLKAQVAQSMDWGTKLINIDWKIKHRDGNNITAAELLDNKQGDVNRVVVLKFDDKGKMLKVLGVSRNPDRVDLEDYIREAISQIENSKKTGKDMNESYPKGKIDAKKLADKMRKVKSMKGLADKIEKKGGKISADELDKMLPDYVPGQQISKLFEMLSEAGKQTYVVSNQDGDKEEVEASDAHSAKMKIIHKYKIPKAGRKGFDVRPKESVMNEKAAKGDWVAVDVDTAKIIKTFGSHRAAKRWLNKQTGTASIQSYETWERDYGHMFKGDEKYLKEAVNRDAVEIIAKYTNIRDKAIEKFIKNNNIDSVELAKHLKKGSLKDRLDFGTAVIGKEGNKFEKKFAKMFAEAMKKQMNEILTEGYDTYEVTTVKMGEEYKLKVRARNEKHAEELAKRGDLDAAGAGVTVVKNVERIRESNINEAVNPSDTMKKILDVVEEKQAQEIGGFYMDLTTAGIIKQVWEKANRSQKEKLNKLEADKIADIALKLTK